MDELLLRRSLLFKLNSQTSPDEPPTPIITPVTIDAFPILGGTSLDVGNEFEYLVLAVTNNQNVNTQYNITATNSDTSKHGRDFVIASPQIDIYNGLSLFIVKKGGYHLGVDGDYTVKERYVMSCDFNVSGDNVTNTKTFTLWNGTTMLESQHQSRVRQSLPGFTYHVNYVPYSTSNLSYQTKLYGLAQGGVDINNNSVSYYTNGSAASDSPNMIKTYSVNNNHIIKYQKGKPVTSSYDYTMLSNMSIQIGIRESSLNYTVTKNSLDRLRFSVIRLSSNTTINGSDDSDNEVEWFQANLQESNNLRFVLVSGKEGQSSFISYNLAKVIDLSKPGTYEVQSESADSKKCYLKLLNSSLVSGSNPKVIVYDKNHNRLSATAGSAEFSQNANSTRSSATFYITVN